MNLSFVGTLSLKLILISYWFIAEQENNEKIYNLWTVFRDFRKIPQTDGNISLPKYFVLSRTEIVFIKCLLFIFSVCNLLVKFSELVLCSQILPIN